MSFISANIPLITNCYLSDAFLYNKLIEETSDLIPIEIFGITCLSRRCLLFQVMSDKGARFARVPIHYIFSSTTYNQAHLLPLDWLQLWDCFSSVFTVVKYDYHKHSKAKIQLKDKTFATAKYLFTIDWGETPDYPYGGGENAGNHKEHHIFQGIEREDGTPIIQLFAQPNNRVIWQDAGSFIANPLKTKPDWKVFSKEFSCEAVESKYVSEDTDNIWYEFMENK